MSCYFKGERQRLVEVIKFSSVTIRKCQILLITNLCGYTSNDGSLYEIYIPIRDFTLVNNLFTTQEIDNQSVYLHL